MGEELEEGEEELERTEGEEELEVEGRVGGREEEPGNALLSAEAAMDTRGTNPWE